MSAFKPTTAQSKFVAVVAKLTAPMDAQRASQALMDMLPALNTLPPGVFCDAAAEHIGRNAQFGVPSYGALHKALELWWSVNQPKHAGDLIGGDDATLDADDRGWLRYWQRHKVAGFPDVSAAADLRLCRQYRPRMFAYLLRTDEHAQQVAALNGWTLPGQRAMPTADEIAHVERTAADARAAIAATAGGLHARAPVHMTNAGARTVEEAVEQVRREYDKAYPPKVNTPEEIEAMRAANPTVQKARADQARRAAGPPQWDEPVEPPANDRASARAAAAATPPPPTVRFPWHDDADADAEVVP